MTTTRPARVWAEVTGGDALGRGHQPALCWWLPEGSSAQHAYQVRTDDGFGTGRVDGDAQSFVRVPVFDRSRRFAVARVRVWTDLGESEWSDPVALESGLLEDGDWRGAWIGVAEPGVQGSGAVHWLRTSFEVPSFGRSLLYITALGLYEAFIDGHRVGDAELAPGYTQYRARVQYQAYDVTPLVRPGRHALAVLLADGWYRGQVDEVVSAGDGDVFEPRFTTHGFRYVRVEGHPGPLGPGDVTGVVVHSDLRRLGWFGCGDDRVSRLHEAVVWSLRSNICDIPTDCPQRERAGWTGDWQIFAPTAAYLYRSAATLVRIAGVLGLPEEQWHRYQEIAEGALDAWRREYAGLAEGALDAWRREFLRPDGTLAVPTQASHVRALAFGLVPDELRPAVADRLAELVAEAGGHLATGFLSTPYLLPARPPSASAPGNTTGPLPPHSPNSVRDLRAHAPMRVHDHVHLDVICGTQVHMIMKRGEGWVGLGGGVGWGIVGVEGAG